MPMFFFFYLIFVILFLVHSHVLSIIFLGLFLLNYVDLKLRIHKDILLPDGEEQMNSDQVIAGIFLD